MSEQEEKSPPVWFVRHEQVPMGPFSGVKIRHLLLEGELTLADQISKDRKKWLKMVDVPEVVPLQLRAEAGDAKAQAILAQRRQSEASSVADERRVPWVALLVMIGVLGGVMGLAVWVGMPQQADTPQCDATPAPGVNWRNCVLIRIDVGSASLAGADLNSAVLRDASLSATNLSGADLRYSDFTGADLRYADLSGSQLLGANLQAADLRGSNLSRSDLRYADLTSSRLEDARLDGANLGQAIWRDGTTCAENSVGRCLKATR
ncbi:MAG: pentapeptide repeat-containing protein [Candidatus Thiodiazotropha sp.]|jgi:hypothetical protein